MTSKTSITYGGALYDLAKDEGLSAQILADLGAFAAVFRENPDYRRLLTEPSIPKAEREALLDEAWKDALHPYTLNFVKLLCANGTVSQLPDCETVYRARYNEDNNILAVTAVSAAPMREELQEKLGVAYLFIAHDLLVVRHISKRIAVMYLGKIVEVADSDELNENPQHPYTQSLLSAVPIPDPDVTRARQRIVLEGDVPSPLNMPTGCSFRTRCRYATEQCAKECPALTNRGDGHFVACWNK